MIAKPDHSKLSLIVVMALLQLPSFRSTAQDMDVRIAGRMSNVMIEGDLSPNINIDTLNRTNLYGIGPLDQLRGEIMIWNGKSYVATVSTNSEIKVQPVFKVKAPFFVWANVAGWKEFSLPDSVVDDVLLEKYLAEITQSTNKPFAFRISGAVTSAKIHVVNLPDGTKVQSHADAKQGQVDLDISNEDVNIIGFFSKHHQGIFTHHSSYAHMHLMTFGGKLLGHVDEVRFIKGKTTVAISVP